MKLLFDENLSPKLVRRLADLFPDSVHVRDVGLQAADDPPVWEFAKNNGLIIVSKDSDMHQRSFTLGHPPKIIWLRLGNCSTSQVEEVLRRNLIAIRAFYEDDFASFLSLSWGARSKS
jgi:predicted nuclease of predicted toxin-antitoxin system